MMMQFIGKTMGKGLVVVLPVLLSIYLVIWVGQALEGLFRPIVERIPFFPYIPGSGVVLVLAVIFVVGLVMGANLARRIWRYLEVLLARIPLINWLYGSLRDLVRLFGSGGHTVASKVVTIDLPDGRGKLLGFITRDKFDDLPASIGGPDSVAVYFPMSYQLGGYTVIVPRSAVSPVDLPIDKAMRFALTGGVKTEEEQEEAR